MSKLDFEILVATTKILKAKTILEFGPGASTYAFIEAGATHIDTFESLPEFEKKYKEEFSGFDMVHVLGGEYPDTPIIYDFAFVDGPKGADKLSRIGALDYAYRHSKVVALHDTKREGEQESLELLRNKYGALTRYIDTEAGITFITKP